MTPILVSHRGVVPLKQQKVISDGQLPEGHWNAASVAFSRSPEPRALGEVVGLVGGPTREWAEPECPNLCKMSLDLPGIAEWWISHPSLL